MSEVLHASLKEQPLLEDIILQVPTLATSAKFVGGSRVKVPINVGYFSRPTLIL